MSEQLQFLAFDKRKPKEEQARFEDDDGPVLLVVQSFPVIESGGKAKIFVCKAILIFFFSLTIRKKFPDVWENQNLAN